MTEESTSTETNDETSEATETPVQLPDDHPLVKTLAAQKEALRELKAKAAKLDEIEEANKTESQRLAERAENAERELAAVQSSALRAEVALEKGLTPSQAKRLIGSSREELEADADELLKDLGNASKPRAPKPDPNQGRSSSGSASTAEQFAAAIEGQFTR